MLFSGNHITVCTLHKVAFGIISLNKAWLFELALLKILPSVQCNNQEMYLAVNFTTPFSLNKFLILKLGLHILDGLF